MLSRVGQGWLGGGLAGLGGRCRYRCWLSRFWLGRGGFIYRCFRFVVFGGFFTFGGLWL